MMRWTSWIVLGSLFSLLSVVIGAFGAHALKGRLGARELEWIDIGVRYQMFHAMAIIAIGLMSLRLETKGLMTAGWLFSLGILLFSGSLYGMAIGGWRAGMITPLGGVSFVFGWIVLIITMLRL